AVEPAHWWLRHVALIPSVPVDSGGTQCPYKWRAGDSRIAQDCQADSPKLESFLEESADFSASAVKGGSAPRAGTGSRRGTDTLSLDFFWPNGRENAEFRPCHQPAAFASSA